VHCVTSRRGTEDFDCVVSNADLHHTYSRLYRDDADAKKRTRKLERLDWSMSLFVLYFGTRKGLRRRGAPHRLVRAEVSRAAR
jgi:phytoene desaturase